MTAFAALDAATPAPAPALAKAIPLTATDIASIVAVNQALASLGLPRLATPDGELTVSEFQAKHAGTIAAAAAAAEGTVPVPPPLESS